MARFLLGEEIDTVSAQASVLVDKAIGEAGDYDSVSVMLSTASIRHRASPCSVSTPMTAALMRRW